MTSTDREDQRLFENEVRRIARELWPEAQYGGARIIDGSQRDGVFETEDCVSYSFSFQRQGTRRYQEALFAHP